MIGNNYFYGPEVDAALTDTYNIGIINLTCRVAIGFVSDDLFKNKSCLDHGKIFMQIPLMKYQLQNSGVLQDD